MKISDVSIRNPVFAWMLMFGLMIFGGICFSRMGVSQMPDADFPVVSVSMTLEGAAPEVMEQTVVDPLENSFMTLQGVKSITSTAKTGSASVSLEFDLDKDIDVAIQEIQSKVTAAQRRLPVGIEPANISKTNPDDQPIIWLAATHKKGDRKALMAYVRDHLRDRFTTIKGVGDIFLGGYIDPNLRVWIKPEALRQHNIAVTDVLNAISKEHSEIPGGLIETEDKNFNVRTMGEAKTVDEFKNIAISQRAGAQVANPFNIVRIKQVADVEEGLADVTRIARFNGETAVGIGIRKQKGSNAVEVARLVKAKVAELQETLPENYTLNINFDTTQFIEESIHELNFHLILSALLTAFACWIFLGSWTATLNVVLSIPTSILGAFIPMYFLGFTLNTFTLLGLSLAIGIVVDDAIMVLENIFRHQEKGKNKTEAAIVGAREITFAAMAATVAVVAIFLPVAFMKGVIGKFFFQFGVTISAAVLFSLLEALTITPMRSAQFVTTQKRTTKLGIGFENFIAKGTLLYQRSLIVCLNHRWKTLGASLVFLATSLFSIKFINKEFSPPQDQSIFLIRMQTPVGSSLNLTDDRVKKAEEFLKTRGEVSQYFVSVGGFGTGGADTNNAMMFLSMKKPKDRPVDPEKGRRLTQMEFMDVVRKNLQKIKDLKPVIQDLSMRGFSSSRGFPVEFTIQGGDWDKLAELSQSMMSEMEKSGLMTDVDTNYLLGMPELQITPDRQQAAFHGISVQAIGQTVNTLIGGVRAGEYAKEGKRNEIRVRVVPEYDKLKGLENLMVGNARGNLIPLSQVVTQEMKKSLQQITRIDRMRAISVYANIKPGGNQQVALDKVQEIGKKILPEGYSIGLTGSAQTMKESFESLVFALVMGLVVAYMVLASQFNSFIDPVSVLLALPFSISGAFLALLISGNTINLFSMIGLILLMGIVKKNSILLVEFTNEVRAHGKETATSALIKACPIRLRPIIMTSFATIAGALPQASGIGAGGETRQPMAISIIGGVLVSTFLTLYVVPAAYSLLDKLARREKSDEEIKRAFAAAGEA